MLINFGESYSSYSILSKEIDFNTGITYVEDRRFANGEWSYHIKDGVKHFKIEDPDFRSWDSMPEIISRPKFDEIPEMREVIRNIKFNKNRNQMDLSYYNYSKEIEIYNELEKLEDKKCFRTFGEIYDDELGRWQEVQNSLVLDNDNNVINFIFKPYFDNSKKSDITMKKIGNDYELSDKTKNISDKMKKAYETAKKKTIEQWKNFRDIINHSYRSIKSQVDGEFPEIIL